MHTDDSACELPVFGNPRIALDYRELKYNPCNDVIFPSLLRAADFLRRPLATWYMYYAPHNAPGGICLATAPSLKGPWTEYGSNPLITNDWPPHYHVSHVSSPDVVWVEEERKLFCFYHGENDSTRYASSADGITFHYEGVAMSCRDLPPSDSISYNRVYRHALSPECRYVMIVVSYRPGHQAISIARSPDARAWRIDPQPLITAPVVPGSRYAWSSCLWRWRQRWWLAYHVDFFEPEDRDDMDPLTHIYASEVNEALTQAGSPRLLVAQEFFNPGAARGRAADPCIVEEGGRLYLFASIGRRLNQQIACADAAACLTHLPAAEGEDHADL